MAPRLGKVTKVGKIVKGPSPTCRGPLPNREQSHQRWGAHPEVAKPRERGGT